MKRRATARLFLYEGWRFSDLRRLPAMAFASLCRKLGRSLMLSHNGVAIVIGV